MADSRRQMLRQLPQIDELLRSEEVQQAGRGLGARTLAGAVRETVAELRRGVLGGRLTGPQLRERLAALPGELRARIAGMSRSSMRPVINATGVVVHTNLGRAPLARGALERVVQTAAGYSTLEYDLAAGQRGSRGSHLEAAGARLFPGHALHAVNNNAAAVLLVLNTIAQGREVLISRGELVEIGGSFRIPEIMARSGAILREVGTTNRTRISDFRRAVSPSTGMILQVHTSNYRIVGFTAAATLEELVALGREHSLPVVVDQGSGDLADLSGFGIPDEPTAAGLLARGADLVLFSGDKMLGGPQAGIIVGSPELVRRCRENPLARALRLDKMTIAALEWTMQRHASSREMEEVPVLRMISEPLDSLARRAKRIAAGIRRAAGGFFQVELLEGTSMVGGGAAPLTRLPSRVVAISSARLSAERIDETLRLGETPVVGRLHEGRLLFDPRTVLPGQETSLINALAEVARSGERRSQ